MTQISIGWHKTCTLPSLAHDLKRIHFRSLYIRNSEANILLGQEYQGCWFFCGFPKMPPLALMKSIDWTTLCPSHKIMERTWNSGSMTQHPYPRQGSRSVSEELFGSWLLILYLSVFVKLNQYSQILRRQCCLGRTGTPPSLPWKPLDWTCRRTAPVQNVRTRDGSATLPIAICHFSLQLAAA